MIGKTVAKELFEGQSPVGRQVRIRNSEFTVVGVLSAKGANLMGMDQDDTVLMPWTTARSLLIAVEQEGKGAQTRSRWVDQIVVRAASAGKMDEAIDQITDLLRQRHRIREGDDFNIRDMRK